MLLTVICAYASASVAQHQRNSSFQANMASAAPTSLQDIGEAISPQDNDTFNFADFSPTKIGILLMSSAAPISLQDSDTLQDSDASDLGDFDARGDVDAILKIMNDTLRAYAILSASGMCSIDTYRIEHKLGHGDFSTVWLARDIKKKRDVALKIMIPGDAGDI